MTNTDFLDLSYRVYFFLICHLSAALHICISWCFEYLFFFQGFGVLDGQDIGPILHFTPIPFFIFFNTLSILDLYILYDHSLKVVADLSA